MGRIQVTLANRDLERFGVRLLATYRFPAQVLFGHAPITTLADLRDRQGPAVRALSERTFAELSSRPWRLGAGATCDGTDRNNGNREASRIHNIAAQPMTEVKPIDADRAEMRRIFESRVPPGFVQRCGTICNDVTAPICGARFGS